MLTRESSDLMAGDGRTVTVQLAEWGEPRTVSDDGRTEYREAFDSMDPAGKIRVKSSHDGDLIGHAVADSYRPDPQPTIDLHLAETAAGNDTLALIRSGAIDAVSVEFVPSGDDYTDDGVLHRVAARINGIAMAFRPAHSAPILALREVPEETNPESRTMSEAITPDAVTAADLAVFGDDLKREVLAVRPDVAPTHPLAQYRGIGELTRDLINGNGDVKELQRVLADNIIANSPGVARPKFVNDVKQTVDFGRPTITAFGTESVTDGEGMSINWPVNANDESTLVGLQAAEKTAVTTAVWNITNGTAALGSYAGASDVSYALLRRSTPAYLAQYTAALYRGYAITTDIAAATQVVAAAVDAPGWWDPAAGTAEQFKRVLFDASIAVESATNMPASFVLASSDTYSAIGALEGVYPAPYGTQNVVGTADARSLNVNVSGIPVIHDRFLAAGTIIVSNPSTGAWHEDGPFQVSAEDVEKMGRNIGVFGMGVFTDYVPNGIVSIATVAPA